MACRLRWPERGAIEHLMTKETIYQRLGLRRAINAAGKMTALGGSAVAPEVAQAMAEAGQDYVDIAELLRVAGERVAEATGAEAGFVTSSASAGVVLGTAACVARGDPARTESLPHPPGPPHRIIIQRGHSVHYGASILQMMAMAGAEVVEIGNTNRTLLHQLSSALDERTAGVMFVISHHTVQSGMLPLETVIELAHAESVPVVVDAGAELDLRKYIAAGADLVIYSGQKGIEGPASGLVAGKERWVAACAQQNSGIGRAMKIGKEGIVGALVALQRALARDEAREADAQAAAAQLMAVQLTGLPGAIARVVTDPVRPISRVRVTVEAGVARLTGRELVGKLEAHDPSIRTRNHALEHGSFEIDFRTLRDGEAEQIVAALKQYLK